jgi:N-acetyl-alpha-D-muramate 1-phosphate uridylyltransferase
MKALIFAAGFGERMRPLTLHTPKPLLQIKGKSLIRYHIDALKKAGITDLVINLSHLGEQIKAALGDGSTLGTRIQYSEEGPVPLETGGGMKHALSLLGSEPFVAVNGDIYVDFDYSLLPRLSQQFAHLVMVPNPTHHPLGDFILLANKLYTCPPNTSCATSETCNIERLTFSGIGVYHPKLLEGTPNSAFRLAPVLREAMAFGQVTGQRFDGVWHDVGTPERLAQLNV